MDGETLILGSLTKDEIKSWLLKSKDNDLVYLVSAAFNYPKTDEAYVVFMDNLTLALDEIAKDGSDLTKQRVKGMKKTIG